MLFNANCFSINLKNKLIIDGNSTVVFCIHSKHEYMHESLQKAIVGTNKGTRTITDPSVLIAFDGTQMLSFDLDHVRNYENPFVGSGCPISFVNNNDSHVIWKQDSSARIIVRSLNQDPSKLNSVFNKHQNELTSVTLATLPEQINKLNEFMEINSKITNGEDGKQPFHKLEISKDSFSKLVYTTYFKGNKHRVFTFLDDWMVLCEVYGQGSKKLLATQYKIDLVGVFPGKISLPDFGIGYFEDYRTGDRLNYQFCNKIPSVEDSLLIHFSAVEESVGECIPSIRGLGWNPFPISLKEINKLVKVR